MLEVIFLFLCGNYYCTEGEGGADEFAHYTVLPAMFSYGPILHIPSSMPSRLIKGEEIIAKYDQYRT